MESTMLTFMTLLCIGPYLTEGSEGNGMSPSTNDSDTQSSSFGTSLSDRNGSLINYSKGQIYTNTPSFSYPSTASNYHKNYNYNYNPSFVRPTSSYYNYQRGDKSDYRGNMAIGTGRAVDRYQPSGGYTYASRFSKAYPDPHRSRYASYNLPQNFRSTYVYGGSFQKGSSGYSYPANTGQFYRGSRVYEEPNKAHFNIPTRTKSTGVYIIPTPSKLYYDGLKN